MGVEARTCTTLHDKKQGHMNAVQQKHNAKKLHDTWIYNIFDLGGFKGLLSPSMNPNSVQYVRNYKLGCPIQITVSRWEEKGKQ